MNNSSMSISGLQVSSEVVPFQVASLMEDSSATIFGLKGSSEVGPSKVMS